MKFFLKNTFKTFAVTIVMLLYSVTFSQVKKVSSNRLRDESEMCWWYEKPATKYWEGLPIGTGRFAAMVLGKIKEEEIPFNEQTLWSGGPYNPNNPRGPQILKQIRKFVQEKDYVKATAEAVKLSSILMSYRITSLWVRFTFHFKIMMKKKLLTISVSLVWTAHWLVSCTL